MLTERQAGNLRVVLVAARNPLNIGAAARAMSNFGFSRLRVVNRYDVAFREARSAVGAPELLKDAEEFATVEDSVADCSLIVGTTAAGPSRKLEHPLHRLDAGGELICARLAVERVALLFGSEKRGLSNEDLTYCHWLMRIPTRETHSSMNLGQAVAICLYELIRSDRVQLPEVGAGASGAVLERMTRALLDLLGESGYTKLGTEAAVEAKSRRLIRRMSLSEEDAETWTGMLAKIRANLRR
ncbi:MAG TPA: TrmH family RNA methyltransferase [Silvibacterium sp.]|nr:TrmH family RNA methyltransferase [Silvibacterium sp.]